MNQITGEGPGGRGFKVVSLIPLCSTQLLNTEICRDQCYLAFWIRDLLMSLCNWLNSRKRNLTLKEGSHLFHTTKLFPQTVLQTKQPLSAILLKALRLTRLDVVVDIKILKFQDGQRGRKVCLTLKSHSAKTWLF